MLNFLLRVARAVWRRLKKTPPNYWYFGAFATWAEAKGNMIGYADPAIASRVSEAARKVLEGNATYERDSVIFPARQYAFPVATALLWAGAGNNGHLTVLDFGGALGTSYFQNKPFLACLKEVHWTIVEQPTFVAEGRKLFVNGPIQFESDIRAAIETRKPNLTLISSALQYTPNPYTILNNLVAENIEIIVLDRTIFSDNDADQVTIQRVPSTIYTAEYPVWILSEKKFLTFIEPHYHIMDRFKSVLPTDQRDSEKRKIEDLGFILVRRGSSLSTVLEQ